MARRDGAALGRETEGEATSEAGGPLPTIPVDDDFAEVHFRNCHAVLVQGKVTRRHLYFNLPAAERAVARAIARGDSAAMILVQLVPVRGERHSWAPQT